LKAFLYNPSWPAAQENSSIERGLKSSGKD
jgi:hypothetical protein